MRVSSTAVYVGKLVPAIASAIRLWLPPEFSNRSVVLQKTSWRQFVVSTSSPSRIFAHLRTPSSERPPPSLTMPLEVRQRPPLGRPRIDIETTSRDAG